MVCIDECLFEYSGQTSISMLKSKKNIIITRSLSKAFGIAGLRLGYAVASKDVIKELDEYRQPFNVNKIAEAAGIAAFDYVDYYADAIQNIKKTRHSFCKELSSLGFEYMESNAPFVFVNFGNMSNAKKYYNFLISNGILVFAAWDKEFSGSALPFIRFSIGTEEDMSKVIEVLRNATKQHSNYF